MILLGITDLEKNLQIAEIIFRMNFSESQGSTLFQPNKDFWIFLLKWSNKKLRESREKISHFLPKFGDQNSEFHV